MDDYRACQYFVEQVISTAFTRFDFEWSDDRSVTLSTKHTEQPVQGSAEMPIVYDDLTSVYNPGKVGHDINCKITPGDTVAFINKQLTVEGADGFQEPLFLAIPKDRSVGVVDALGVGDIVEFYSGTQRRHFAYRVTSV